MFERLFAAKQTLVDPDRALPGRDTPVLSETLVHEVLGTPLDPVPAGSEVAYLGLGCFWGAEKLYWQLDGVTSTAVGYQGGYTPNPTYEEACSGRTGHVEAVRVAYDPAVISYAELLRVFFENHDPTQGMRQGNDFGTQYRSAIYTADETQAATALAVRDQFQAAFTEKGFGEITTEIAPAGPFYLAEAYHQQYLRKNPNGYCPIHATGVTCN
ncbi:peptide-methionine (S)-S-oxide reductase MsrA [Auraticoccus monumenti]|uniref:Peptide methionine sulfoxide reductase MsrA n=1 Tax=Auraticoccus monumenti TaxID=675864 RepID=A0A1G6ZTT7_9ACTN|nr:peptide-methionine (S)-S-oxide reductase MsrA [Auraticoccus monumenti]SDE04986.1 peptide-methionine (S)-S-oxide reductase [Auraticoccus monumenti]